MTQPAGAVATVPPFLAINQRQGNPGGTRAGVHGTPATQGANGEPGGDLRLYIHAYSAPSDTTPRRGCLCRLRTLAGLIDSW